MATEFNYSIERIIARALRICGKYASNEDPLPEDYSIGVENLNSILNDWTNEGIIQPQYIKTAKVLLPNGMHSVTLSNDITNILDCYILTDSEEIDRTLSVISYSNYVSMISITSYDKPGAVSFYGNKLLFYPIADDDYNILVNYTTYMNELVTAEDKIIISPNFHEALVYSLAVRFADEFMLPVNDKILLERRAESYFKRATANRIMNERTIQLNPNTGGIV